MPRAGRFWCGDHVIKRNGGIERAGAGRSRTGAVGAFARFARFGAQLANRRRRPRRGRGRTPRMGARSAQPRQVALARHDDLRGDDGRRARLARCARLRRGGPDGPQHGRQGRDAAGLPASGARATAHCRGYRAQGLPLARASGGIRRDERTAAGGVALARRGRAENGRPRAGLGYAEVSNHESGTSRGRRMALGGESACAHGGPARGGIESAASGGEWRAGRGWRPVRGADLVYSRRQIALRE